jgi:multidrug efflux pump subunit AcrA (membrane-fusion protein)
METEVKNRRKDRIKNAAIIFLVFMLILTLCAPTILNFSLPQVAVIMPNRSPISEQVRGSSTVEAAATYDVKAESERGIGAVMVKVGETVAEGQTLFTLSAAEGAEFEELQNRVDALQNEYDKMLLATGKDYSLDNLDIEKQKAALALLVSKKENAPALEKAYNEAVTARKTAEALQKELEDQKGEVDSIISDFANENYDFLDAEYVKIINDIVKNKETVEKQKAASDIKLKELEADLASTGGTDLSGYRTALERAKINVDTASYAITAFQITNTAPPGDPTAAATLAGLYEALSAAEAELAIAQSNYDTALSNERTESTLKGRLKNEQRANQGYQKRIDTLEADLAKQRVSINKTLRERSKKLEDGVTDAKNTVTEATEAETKAKEAMGDTVAELDTQITNMEFEIRSKQLTLAQKQAEDAAAAGQSAVDVTAKKNELDRAKEKLEEAKVEAETSEIVAPITGTIMSVTAASGTTAKVGDTLCTIAVLERGLEVSFSVSADQARQVNVGMDAEIENYWGNAAPVVKLARIATDPDDPSKKILTFSVVGDISVGYRAEIAVGERAADYNAVIPASAIREDNDGKFVLVCVQKSTPIGSRYIAERKAVNVAATNGQISAVDGSLERGEWVITTSTQPISAGVQVRLKN